HCKYHLQSLISILKNQLFKNVCNHSKSNLFVLSDLKLLVYLKFTSNSEQPSCLRLLSL
ncbi:mCG140984, partial [Mus musculus]